MGSGPLSDELWSIPHPGFNLAAGTRMHGQRETTWKNKQLWSAAQLHFFFQKHPFSTGCVKRYLSGHGQCQDSIYARHPNPLSPWIFLFRSAIPGGLLAGHGQVATDLRHSAFSDKSVAGLARLFVQLHKKQKSSLDGFLFKFKHCTSHFQSPFRETNLACKPPILSFCHAFSEAQMCFIASCIVKLIWPSMAYLCTGSKQIKKRAALLDISPERWLLWGPLHSHVLIIFVDFCFISEQTKSNGVFMCRWCFNTVLFAHGVPILLRGSSKDLSIATRDQFRCLQACTRSIFQRIRSQSQWNIVCASSAYEGMTRRCGSIIGQSTSSTSPEEALVMGSWTYWIAYFTARSCRASNRYASSSLSARPLQRGHISILDHAQRDAWWPSV